MAANINHPALKGYHSGHEIEIIALLLHLYLGATEATASRYGLTIEKVSDNND